MQVQGVAAMRAPCGSEVGAVSMQATQEVQVRVRLQTELELPRVVTYLQFVHVHQERESEDDVVGGTSAPAAELDTEPRGTGVRDGGIMMLCG